MSDNFIGEIRLFAGNFAPANWALCNGQTLSIQQNTALFSLIGTTYGGDGVTNFNLPNLQGRVPVGEGQGPGLSNRIIGMAAGVEQVTLATANLPLHTHTLSASSAAATAFKVDNSLPGTVSASHFYVNNTGTPAPTFGNLNPQSVSPAGANLPHSNLMPTLCLSFIIALSGIYPSRS